MPRYFPLYADIAGKRCVVIGGGAVAERKVADLRAADAHVCVVSPDLTANLQTQAQRAEIEYLPERYAPPHLEGALLVFAATNSREVNAQIARDAASRRLFVNVADAPEEGGFVTPSVVRHGDFCLSVSTGGNNPMLARKVSADLQAQYGPEWGALVELLGQMRALIKTRTSDAGARRAMLSRLIAREADLRALLRDGKIEEARHCAEEIVSRG